ncbi:MAG: hypothetical protein A2017_13215 [Lentisphaerae bacterium GWF2_44_16]|nr:MAG: hypothetical protein A2017_13215 [Lentisphaerae bacterium GWF2_44_16]
MKKEQHVINVKERTETGKGFSRRSRRTGSIPAIIYCKGKENKNLIIDAREWGHVAKHDVKLVDLKKENGELCKALIKEIQEDFLKGNVLHIDFQEVRMDEVITAFISIYAMPGTVPVGLSMGGILEQPMHEIEVSCLPGDLPESIEVDISKIELEQSLHVREIVMPGGVTAVSDPNGIVFHVGIQAAEESATAAAEGAEGATPAEGAEGAAAGDAKADAKGDAKADAKDAKDAKGDAKSDAKADKKK